MWITQSLCPWLALGCWSMNQWTRSAFYLKFGCFPKIPVQESATPSSAGKKSMRGSVCVYSVAQSYLTLWGPMDCSLPGFSAHGIFQATILERGAISYSRGSSRPRDWARISCISCIGRRTLYLWGSEPWQNWYGRQQFSTTMVCVLNNKGSWVHTDQGYKNSRAGKGLG